MIVAIDPASSVAPYDQLREQIGTMIAAGTLEVGARLPTIRQLAGDLGLAPGTVARAYRELEARGLIETRGRRGSFVAERPVPGQAVVAAGDEELAVAARVYAATAAQLGFTRDEALDVLREAFREFAPTP